MIRYLNNKELALINMLIDVNESIGQEKIEQLRKQIIENGVYEVDSPYFLGFVHDQNLGSKSSDVYRLSSELVATDGGVPVLIYATYAESGKKIYLDTFVVDRLDGEGISEYPNNFDKMMVVEEGKMKSGADLRHLYGSGSR